MAKVLKITKYPDQLLRQKSRELSVEEINSPKIQELIDDMIETMWAVDGIGLAAIQVGQPLRLAIVTQEKDAIVIVNPVVKSTSFKKEVLGQGCLSVPGYSGEVKRPVALHLDALDRHGNPLSFKAQGLISHIIQHEVDHLNGILFFDKAKNLEPHHPDDK